MFLKHLVLNTSDICYTVTTVVNPLAISRNTWIRVCCRRNARASNEPCLRIFCEKSSHDITFYRLNFNRVRYGDHTLFLTPCSFLYQTLNGTLIRPGLKWWLYFSSCRSNEIIRERKNWIFLRVYSKIKIKNQFLSSADYEQVFHYNIFSG